MRSYVIGFLLIPYLLFAGFFGYMAHQTIGANVPGVAVAK